MGNAVGIDASGPLLRWAFVFNRPYDLENPRDPISFHGSSRVDVADPPKCRYPNEADLLAWFSTIECWRQPWFDTHHYNGEAIRVYYIITCWTKVYALLSTGLEALLQMHKERKRLKDRANVMEYKVRCTGSRRKDLSRIADEIIGMRHLMEPTLGYDQLASFIHLKGLQEIHCTIRGFDFFLKGSPASCFKYKRMETRQKITIAGRWSENGSYCDATPPSVNIPPARLIDLFTSVETDDHQIVTESIYPYLLVHVKNGCSFHLVNAKGEARRVGGSVIGAGTFLGLASILCPSVHSPFDAFLLACTGDNSKVDIQVSDIYGGDYGKIGLEGGLVASSFGKMQPTKLKKELRELLPSITANRVPRVSSASILAPQRSNLSTNGPSYLDHQSSCLDVLNLDDDHTEITSEMIRENLMATANEKDHRIATTNGNNDIRITKPRRDSKAPMDKEQENEAEGGFGKDLSPPKRSSAARPSNKATPPPNPSDLIEERDMARSLLTLMTYNLTQQAYLNALLHRVPRIVFSGFYLEMPGYLSALQACVHFWDSTGGIGGIEMNEPIDTVFVRLAPFLAAVGAALTPV